MAARYAFPRRLNIIGDRSVADKFVARGDTLLGNYINRLAEAGIRTGRESRQADGVRFTYGTDGSMPFLTIEVSPVINGEVADLPSMWVPRGFVVYPASDASPLGWGTPVFQDISVTQYGRANLAPGLDVARWTSNGRIGEVLLTKAPGAGYPSASALIAPYLYTTTVGLTLRRTFRLPALGDTWAAYRVEFVGFSGHSPSLTTAGQSAIVSQKRALFKLLNDDRLALELDPVLLPIRGRADTAQATAEVMAQSSTVGHNSKKYVDGYRVSSDRTSKDGLLGYQNPTNAASRDKPTNVAEETAGVGSSIIETDPDPSGFPTFTIVAAGTITAQQAWELYLSEPLHKLGFEAPQWNGGHTSVQFGFKGAFNSTNLCPNTNWIPTGNRYWLSQYAEVPPLSFCGFTSANLGYETWPVTFDNRFDIARPAPLPPVGYDPVSVLFGLTAGDFFWKWNYFAYDPSFVYGQVADPSTLNFSAEQVPYAAPALDNRIFCRGRCIAVAPPPPGGTKTGWVLAAGVQKFDSPDADKFNVYRLIALVHHEEDQPSDQKTNGMTAFLRVWWCDLPNNGPLAVQPHQIIREVYGQEDHGWPWDLVNSPYSWKGGTLLDVGSTDGSARDSLKYASQWTFSPDGSKAICMRDVGTIDEYAELWVPNFLSSFPYSNAIPVWGQAPRALELTFGGNQFSDLTVSETWYPSGVSAPYTFDEGGADEALCKTSVIAAGYTAGNTPKFAMIVSAEATPTERYPNLVALYFGGYADKPGPFAGTVFGYDSQRTGFENILFPSQPAVLDVRDEAFLVVAPYFEGTAQYNPCFLNSPVNVGTVNVWRQGVLLKTLPFANPDAVIYDLRALECDETAITLPLSVNSMVVPSYASNGADWVMSVVVVPQATVAVVANGTSSAPSSCRTQTCSTYIGMAGASSLDPQVLQPEIRNAWWGGSIGDLSALTQTPGNGYGLYARVV